MSRGGREGETERGGGRERWREGEREGRRERETAQRQAERVREGEEGVRKQFPT